MSTHNGELVVQVHQNPFSKPRMYIGKEEIPVGKVLSVETRHSKDTAGNMHSYVTLEFEVDRLEILTETPVDTVRNQIQATFE